MADCTLELAWKTVKRALSRCGLIGAAIIKKDEAWLEKQRGNWALHRLEKNDKTRWDRLVQVMSYVATTAAEQRKARAAIVKDVLLRLTD